MPMGDGELAGEAGAFAGEAQFGLAGDEEAAEEPVGAAEVERQCLPACRQDGLLRDAEGFKRILLDVERPLFMIFLVVVGFNLMGDGLRDALDPRAS